MIIPVEMFTAECDLCGTHAEFGDFTCYGDKDSVRHDITANGWHITDDGKCYCEECYSYDENVELVLTPPSH